MASKCLSKKNQPKLKRHKKDANNLKSLKNELNAIPELMWLNQMSNIWFHICNPSHCFCSSITSELRHFSTKNDFLEIWDTTRPLSFGLEFFLNIIATVLQLLLQILEVRNTVANFISVFLYKMSHVLFKFISFIHHLLID